MKRISTIEDLQLEKKKLNLYRYELEKELHNNWNNLKESLNPAFLTGLIIKNVLNYKTVKSLAANGIFKEMLTYAITLLARKLTDKAEEKFNTIFKK